MVEGDRSSWFDVTPKIPKGIRRGETSEHRMNMDLSGSNQPDGYCAVRARVPKWIKNGFFLDFDIAWD